MMANFRFKLLTAKKKFEIMGKKYNVQKLQKLSIREELKLELKNSFSLLSTQNEDTDRSKLEGNKICIYRNK
jgi:hypothetical protein